MLQQRIADAVDAGPGIDWSVCIRDEAGDRIASHNADVVVRTASIGKLLLLAEVARQCDAGELDSSELLDRDPDLRVADSGVWQYLRVEKLCVHDLCVLVAGVSDNTATNVLVKHVGLQRLREIPVALGMASTALLDYVRDERGPDDPPTLSLGSAAELSSFMSLMARKLLVSRAVSEQLDAWLAIGMDLSMVASAFGLDPLAHTQFDRGYSLRNKTGTDTGIRADVGTIARCGRWFSYAVIANWEADDPGPRDAVLGAMSSIGRALRDALPRDS